MTDQQPDRGDESSEDNDKPAAGFDLNLDVPGLRAHFWGGKPELALLWPWLRWIAIGLAAVYGITQIIGALK